jgi:hypothetical protein
MLHYVQHDKGRWCACHYHQSTIAECIIHHEWHGFCVSNADNRISDNEIYRGELEFGLWRSVEVSLRRDKVVSFLLGVEVCTAIFIK